MAGRPRKSDQERRQKPLRIRLAVEEREIINKAAKSCGLDSSAWARSLLLREAKKNTENP